EKINTLSQLDYFEYSLENQTQKKDDYFEHNYSYNVPPHNIVLDKEFIGVMITNSLVNKKKFELSTFMFIPNIIEVSVRKLYDIYDKLTNSSYTQPLFNFDEDESLSERAMDKRDKDIRNQQYAKEDIAQELYEKADDDYHIFLMITYMQNMDFDEYIMEDKEELLKLYMEDFDFITEDEFNIYFKDRSLHTDKLTNREKQIYFTLYNNFFDLDFIDTKNRRFNDLSHGEKTLFGQLLNIYFHSLTNDRVNNLLLYFDEPELTLHPNWQKKYINELITLLRKIDKHFHFIFTSHSPFLLSDLPKESVIFLNKYENGNCKNITNEIRMKPFGANIHTLLSHGFFMDGGLMGEFAKGKIDEVIKYLKPDEKSTIKDDKEAKSIINIIGEPILRNTLQTMYDAKVYKDESKLDKLRRKQEELQDEIDKIEGKVNEKN
ncbi:MAG: hypothetical protein ACJAWW_001475, partial [Sulfurimonas sp.]